MFTFHDFWWKLVQMPVLVGSAFSIYVLNAGRSKNVNGLSVLHINIAAFQFIFEQHMTVPWVTTNDTMQNVKRRDQTALYSPKDVRTARALLWTIDEPAAPQCACFFLPPLSFLFSRNFLHCPLISTSLPPPLFTPCFLSSFPPFLIFIPTSFSPTLPLLWAIRIHYRPSWFMAQSHIVGKHGGMPINLHCCAHAHARAHVNTHTYKRMHTSIPRRHHMHT